MNSVRRHTRTQTHTHTHTHTDSHTLTYPGNSRPWSCSTARRGRRSSLNDQSAGSQEPPTEVGQHSLNPPHNTHSLNPLTTHTYTHTPPLLFLYRNQTRTGEQTLFALPGKRTQKHIQASVKAIDGDDRRQLFFFLQQRRGVIKCNRDLHCRCRL